MKDRHADNVRYVHTGDLLSTRELKVKRIFWWPVPTLRCQSLAQFMRSYTGPMD